MTYPGGKNGSGVYQTIINLIPPHRTYVEAFLGAGAIMRRKRPGDISIGIDADPLALSKFPLDAVPNLQLLVTDAIDWLRYNRFNRDTFVY